MNELTCKEYWEEVEIIASNLVCDAMHVTNNDREAAEEDINDSRLHETIDGHQWVIYYAYNLDVIKHSDNDDYYSDNFGSDSLAYSLKNGGLNMLHSHIAFWALYADVQDKLEAAFEEHEEVIEV